jgi:predicted solute-binding protein
VTSVPPFERPATYEDLVKLFEHLVAEIADGELHAGDAAVRAEPFDVIDFSLGELWVD